MNQHGNFGKFLAENGTEAFPHRYSAHGQKETSAGTPHQQQAEHSSGHAHQQEHQEHGGPSKSKINYANYTGDFEKFLGRKWTKRTATPSSQTWARRYKMEHLTKRRFRDGLDLYYRRYTWNMKIFQFTTIEQE